MSLGPCLMCHRLTIGRDKGVRHGTSIAQPETWVAPFPPELDMIRSETEALRRMKNVRKACTPESFVVGCGKKLFDERVGVPREGYASKDQVFG